MQVNGHGDDAKANHPYPNSTDGHTFLLSANDASSCTSAKSRLLAYVENLRAGSTIDESRMLSTLSYKLAHKRDHFRWRTAIQASSATDLVESLASAEGSPVLSSEKPSIGFVFTGQGAHWPGMGRELIDRYPVFHEALQQLDQCMISLGASWSITGQ